MGILKIITIGVYGFSEQEFFNALLNAKVDTFCDIRLRRGMRGPKYAFVNKTYLEKKLKEIGIKYLYFKNLAPSKEIRLKQQLEDKKCGVEKKSREILAQTFVEAYFDTVLLRFNSEKFVQEVGESSKIIALFCVEKMPQSCHRSLVLNRLTKDLNLIGEDILP